MKSLNKYAIEAIQRLRNGGQPDIAALVELAVVATHADEPVKLSQPDVLCDCGGTFYTPTKVREEIERAQQAAYAKGRKDERDSCCYCSWPNSVVGIVCQEREAQRAKWGDAHDDEHGFEVLARQACGHLTSGQQPIEGVDWAYKSKVIDRDPRHAQIVKGAALALAALEVYYRQKPGDLVDCPSCTNGNFPTGPGSEWGCTDCLGTGRVQA